MPAWTADCEALDELYDEAKAALSGAGWRVPRGRALAGDTRDWIGRLLVVERDRLAVTPFDPYA